VTSSATASVTFEIVSADSSLPIVAAHTNRTRGRLEDPWRRPHSSAMSRTTLRRNRSRAGCANGGRSCLPWRRGSLELVGGQMPPASRESRTSRRSHAGWGFSVSRSGEFQMSVITRSSGHNRRTSTALGPYANCARHRIAGRRTRSDSAASPGTPRTPHRRETGPELLVGAGVVPPADRARFLGHGSRLLHSSRDAGRSAVRPSLWQPPQPQVTSLCCSFVVDGARCPGGATVREWPSATPIGRKVLHGPSIRKFWWHLR